MQYWEVLPSVRVPARSDAIGRAQTTNLDEMLIKKKAGQGFWP